MTPDKKYYCSQIIAIPTVGIPTVVSAAFLGGLLARLTDLPLGFPVFGFLVGYATSRVTSFATGWLLEKIGLLPRDARRVYPHASSWGEYLKKTGAL